MFYHVMVYLKFYFMYCSFIIYVCASLYLFIFWRIINGIHNCNVQIISLTPLRSITSNNKIHHQISITNWHKNYFSCLSDCATCQGYMLYVIFFTYLFIQVIKCTEPFEVLIRRRVRDAGCVVFNCRVKICYIRVFNFSPWVLLQLRFIGFVHHVEKVGEILGCNCSAVKDANLWEFLAHQHSITLEKTCTLRKSHSDSFGRMYCLYQSLSELCSSDKPKTLCRFSTVSTFHPPNQSAFVWTEFCHHDNGGNMLEETYHLRYCKNPEDHPLVLHTIQTCCYIV